MTIFKVCMWQIFFDLLKVVFNKKNLVVLIGPKIPKCKRTKLENYSKKVLFYSLKIIQKCQISKFPKFQFM